MSCLTLRTEESYTCGRTVWAPREARQTGAEDSRAAAERTLYNLASDSQEAHPKRSEEGDSPSPW